MGKMPGADRSALLQLTQMNTARNKTTCKPIQHESAYQLATDGINLYSQNDL